MCVWGGQLEDDSPHLPAANMRVGLGAASGTATTSAGGGEDGGWKCPICRKLCCCTLILCTKNHRCLPEHAAHAHSLLLQLPRAYSLH